MKKSEAELKDALRKLVNQAFRKPNAEPCFSIPANPDRDADLILRDAIHELISLREQLSEANDLLFQHVELATQADKVIADLIKKR